MELSPSGEQSGVRCHVLVVHHLRLCVLYQVMFISCCGLAAVVIQCLCGCVHVRGSSSFIPKSWVSLVFMFSVVPSTFQLCVCSHSCCFHSRFCHCCCISQDTPLSCDQFGQKKFHQLCSGITSNVKMEDFHRVKSSSSLSPTMRCTNHLKGIGCLISGDLLVMPSSFNGETNVPQWASICGSILYIL